MGTLIPGLESYVTWPYGLRLISFTKSPAGEKKRSGEPMVSVTT